MSTHYTFDPSRPAGSRLRTALNALEVGRANLIAEQATMTADLNGDGSSITHFDNVVTNYGFASTTTAKAAWDEINADLAKISGDGATSNVDTALRQLFTKLR